MDYLAIGFIVMTGLYLFERLCGRKDTNRFLDRIMARGFEEYQYYDKKYQTDLGELKKIRKEERKVREYEEKDVFTDDSVRKDHKEKIKEVLSQYDEDYGEDEVDIEKVMEIEEERKGEIRDAEGKHVA